MITVDVLTLFPRAFEGFLDCGIAKIAREKDLLSVALRDFRAFATDRYRRVDEKPYGGGPGMVLLCSPSSRATKPWSRNDGARARISGRLASSC